MRERHLTVVFTRCSAGRALQCLHTVTAHQRTPLLELQLRVDPGTEDVVATVRSGPLSAHAYEQLARRFERLPPVGRVEREPAPPTTGPAPDAGA